MLPKEDRKAMLLRLYNEDTPLMDHSKDRFHNKAQAGANANADADIKDESVDIKEEEDEAGEEEEGVDADVKDEMAATKGEEGEGGGGADAGEVGDVEMMESGAMAEDDGESERVKEDDALHDAVVKSEAEHR